jgi:hypothetical protein
MIKTCKVFYLYRRLILFRSAISALPAFHALTGCDTTSTFSGKRKSTAYKLIKKDHLAALLEGIGDEWEISDLGVSNTRSFVLSLYGSEMTTLDLARQVTVSMLL